VGRSQARVGAGGGQGRGCAGVRQDGVEGIHGRRGRGRGRDDYAVETGSVAGRRTSNPAVVGDEAALRSAAQHGAAVVPVHVLLPVPGATVHGGRPREEQCPDLAWVGRDRQPNALVHEEETVNGRWAGIGDGLRRGRQREEAGRPSVSQRNPPAASGRKPTIRPT
jgi:hypothetical protein